MEIEFIWGFAIRSILDLFVSLGLFYLFYCLGMRRLWNL
jgi:hypothetical protein